MKRWLVFLFLFCLVFTSASVEVYDYNVSEEYIYLDEVAGNVSLNIDGESYGEKIILSDGSEIMLGDFLRSSGVEFECSPVDCSESYDVLPPGANRQGISLPILEKRHIGFVLSGDRGAMSLQSISFEVASDFGREVWQPLTIKFFEDLEWEFSEFSNEFSIKDSGCFDATERSASDIHLGSHSWCEMVEVRDSPVLKIGAYVFEDGEGLGDLKMSVYNEGGGPIEDCSYDPSQEDGCAVGLIEGDVFDGGKYQVCVASASGDLTDWGLYEDLTGESCGFAYGDGPVDSDEDYGVFAQSLMYADASSLVIPDYEVQYIGAVNDIISDRYNGDCSRGCILPLEISGAPQNFEIYDVDLRFTDDFNQGRNSLVYELNRSFAKVYFNGTLDLGLLGLSVSDDGEYFANLSGEYLFREDIVLLPAPIISSVFPLDAPAAVPVTFYANVDFEGNNSLSYKWDFGDNSSIESDVPSVAHAYSALGNYTLSLRVSAGGNLSFTKSFVVEVISPEAAVNVGLRNKRVSLEGVKESIESFATWYKSDLFSILEIVSIESELDRLDVARNDSFDVGDFRDVAVDLYALNIPTVVGTSGFESPFLISEVGDVNIDPVVVVSGSAKGTSRDYANSILIWQKNNMDVSMENNDVFVSYLNGEDKEVLSVYDFDVTSKSEVESYFVINRPLNELHFKGDVGAKDVEGSTVIVLGAGESKSFGFYYEGVERGSFFISPKLSSFVLEADIEGGCNFNEICEERLGENVDNCRSDCKPTRGLMLLLILLGLVFMGASVGLYVWYKKYYEGYLFKDAKQLRNLLMYVDNARAHGMSNSKIGAELKAKGWSGERVRYVLGKSKRKVSK